MRYCSTEIISVRKETQQLLQIVKQFRRDSAFATHKYFFAVTAVDLRYELFINSLSYI